MSALLLAQVVQMLDPRASLLRAWTLRGGISSRMTVLEFAVEDEQRRVVLRQPDGALYENPQAVANEFAAAAVVDDIWLAVAGSPSAL